MIARAKREGRGELVKGFRRKQKRKPRRLLEAPEQDWKRWDAAATLEGINWSEFCRRALEARVSSTGELAEMAPRVPELVHRVPGAFYGTQISSKPYDREQLARVRRELAVRKTSPRKGDKPPTKKRRAAGAAGKGSSRS